MSGDAVQRLTVDTRHTRTVVLRSAPNSHFALRDLERLCEAMREAGADGLAIVRPERDGADRWSLTAHVDISALTIVRVPHPTAAS